jgi:hypothetical protein
MAHTSDNVRRSLTLAKTRKGKNAKENKTFRVYEKFAARLT